MREPICLQFGVEAFKDYASDTAYRIQAGLADQGFTCFGKRFPGDRNCTDMREVVERERPDIVHVEDWNTWNPKMKQKASADVEFTNWEWVGQQEGILRCTKHADPWHHFEEQKHFQRVFNPHAVLVRYEPDLVSRCAPYMKRELMVRLYHTVTREFCRPVREKGRDRICLLSGACHGVVYPLRTRIWREVRQLPDWEKTFTHRVHHRWLHSGGSAVPGYMEQLARYKVAFVGCSKFLAAFKKLYEATAAGCIVVTNFPETDRVPVVDENLFRVPSDISAEALQEICRELAFIWDEEKQKDLAQRTIARYDYRVEAARIHGILTERWRGVVCSDT